MTPKGKEVKGWILEEKTVGMTGMDLTMMEFVILNRITIFISSG